METTSTPSHEPRVFGESAVDATSAPYVGRWSRLISTTNWEKGRIILEWRTALIEAGASASESTDEAWSLRVGGVTPQHVGRLRRVYQRFGQTHSEFAGLYWSHFQAALDWDDAEMWLEGAVQNGWSVSQLRQTRWETLGGAPGDLPLEQEIPAGELDEDFEPAAGWAPGKDARTRGGGDVQGRPIPEGPDFGDEGGARPAGSPADESAGDAAEFDAIGSDAPTLRPFRDVAELPADLADALESFKLAILRHKVENWAQVAREDVLAALDALRELALAPQ